MVEWERGSKAMHGTARYCRPTFAPIGPLEFVRTPLITFKGAREEVWGEVERERGRERSREVERERVCAHTDTHNTIRTYIPP